VLRLMVNKVEYIYWTECQIDAWSLWTTHRKSTTVSRMYNLKLNCLIFFYWSKQLTDYIYTDIYCKLSKLIGQTPCLYKHYLVA